MTAIKMLNVEGTSATSFTIGKQGTTLQHGTSLDPNTIAEGDFWIDGDSGSIYYKGSTPTEWDSLSFGNIMFDNADSMISSTSNSTLELNDTITLQGVNQVTLDAPMVAFSNASTYDGAFVTIGENGIVQYTTLAVENTEWLDNASAVSNITDTSEYTIYSVTIDSDITKGNARFIVDVNLPSLHVLDIRVKRNGSAIYTDSFMGVGAHTFAGSVPVQTTWSDTDVITVTVQSTSGSNYTVVDTGELLVTKYGAAGTAVWGGITGTITDQTDLVATFAQLSGATFTGGVTATSFTGDGSAITNVDALTLEGTSVNDAGTTTNDLYTASKINSLISAVSVGTSWQDPVIDIQNDPPVGPTSGDRYIIGDTPTGAWAANAEDIAQYNGATWDFSTPSEGWIAWVENLDKAYIYNASNNWVLAISVGSHNNLGGLQGGIADEYYHLSDAQVTLVDNAVQPGDNVSVLINDAGYLTAITSTDVTTALGYTPADEASLATVATSGDYDDLSNKPTIPTDNSELTNGAGYVTAVTADADYLNANIADSKTAGTLTFNDGVLLAFGTDDDVEHAWSGSQYNVDIKNGAVMNIRNADNANEVKYSFDVDSGVMTVTNTIATTSDRGLKTDIEPITGSYATLHKLVPSTFYKHGDAKKKAGTIAQDWEAVMAESVLLLPNDTLGTALHVDAQAQIGYMLNAIQEMDIHYKAVIEAQNEMIANLSDALADIQEKLAGLEKKL